MARTWPYWDGYRQSAIVGATALIQLLFSGHSADTSRLCRTDRPVMVIIPTTNASPWLIVLVLLTLSAGKAAAADDGCETAWQQKAWDRVLQLCLPAAQQGDATAAYRLGEGWDYIADDRRSGPRAARWYRIAADQNHPLAQRNLAALYDAGFGVPKDPWYAFKWYLRAAEQGQPHSQLMVGMMLTDGVGTAADPEQGLRWIASAAEAGESSAQYMYGKLIYAEDPSEAVSWFLKSARQENRYALYRLGLLYFRGEIAGGDPEQALALAERAELAGHPKASVLKRKIMESMPAPLSVSQAPMHSSSSTEQSTAPPGKPSDAGAAVSPARDEQAAADAATTHPAGTRNLSKGISQLSPGPAGDRFTDSPDPRQEEPSAPPTANEGGNWLLQQPAGNYSIQLALMSRLSSIHRFFRLYGLEQQAHYYRSDFNAGPMYVLLWGNFRTQAEARLAMARLPEKVRQMKPWIRQFERLHAGYRPLSAPASAEPP